MYKKKISVFVLIMLVMITPTVSAQLSIAPQANQKTIEVILDEKGNVKVKHLVFSTTNSVTVNLFEGTISNLLVLNEEGEEAQMTLVDDGYGNKSVIIFPTKQKIIIEYDLEDKLFMNENLANIGIKYSEEFSVKFSKKINLIFVNSNPIFLEEKAGINVNGGGELNLQYYLDIPKIIETVQWEEDKFPVEIISDSKIKNFNFEQTSKSISFQINKENKFITITMPQILLGGPYVTLLDDEKIEYAKWVDENENVSITVKPESIGQITIIGTTVIPEFSMFIPLIMGFMIILTVPLMRKFSLR
jgi:hypothetical protein